MCYAWGAWELRSVWPTCKEKGCYLYSLKLITKPGLHVRLNLFIIEYGKGVWIRLQLFACPTQPLPNWSTAGTTTFPKNSNNNNNNNNNNCITWSQLPLHSIGFVSLFKPTMHSRADPPEIKSSCERKFVWHLVSITIMFQSSILNSLAKVIALQVQRFRDPARPISQNPAHHFRADYNWRLIWISQAGLARFMDKAMKA